MLGPIKQNKLKTIYAFALLSLVLFYWYNTWNFDVSISALLVTGAYPADIRPATSPIDQPIEFPHKRHVQKVGVKCNFCHKNVEKGDYATIPNIETCGMCHSNRLTNSSEEQKLRQQYIHKNKTIPWKRVYKVPQDIYFSHKRHVVSGEVNCTTCHGPIDKQSKPPSKPLNELTMEFCLDCHKEREQTEDCLICHR